MLEAIRAVEGEALDVTGARERLVRTSRIPNVLGAGNGDGELLEADLTVRWLAALLKVPLRPVWTPAGKALAEAAGNGRGEKGLGGCVG